MSCIRKKKTSIRIFLTYHHSVSAAIIGMIDQRILQEKRKIFDEHLNNLTLDYE
jgi:hypothetical protein